MSKVRI